MKMFLFGIVALFGFLANAGGSDRGGGSILRCPNRSPVDRIVDFHIGETQLGLLIPVRSGTVDQIVDEDLRYLGQFDPGREKLYRKIIQNFFSDVQWTNSSLAQSPDIGVVDVPLECSVLTVIYQRTDAYVSIGYKRYLINQPLWNALEPSVQASLLMHEAIYRELLASGGTSAIPAQDFNARLAARAITAPFFYKQMLQAYRMSEFRAIGLSSGATPGLSVLQDKFVMFTADFPEDGIEIRGSLQPITGVPLSLSMPNGKTVQIFATTPVLLNPAGLVAAVLANPSKNHSLSSVDQYPQFQPEYFMEPLFIWPGTSIPYARIPFASASNQPFYLRLQPGSSMIGRPLTIGRGCDVSGHIDFPIWQMKDASGRTLRGPISINDPATEFVEISGDRPCIGTLIIMFQ